MHVERAVSRRGFVGGLASGLGVLGFVPGNALWARTVNSDPARAPLQQLDYDALAKLANNENPWGPPPSAMERMSWAFKYANRYGYPDGDIAREIAKHHGVETDHILLGAGSGEILKVVGVTYLAGGKKVVGVEPSYEAVYRHASGIDAEAIKLPLLEDYRKDIPAMIRATVQSHREVGFVYLCSPNNPTGLVVTKREVQQLLDGIPEDVPVLIDEAYHHYVQDAGYATSLPYVLEGRKVIIARTFSKIYGMAGMRLGYAVAPPAMIEEMRPHSTGTINALVKWGAAAALHDTQAEERARRETIQLRTKATADLRALGFSVIPSETNFFMVHIRRPVQPVIAEFRSRGVLVGRPFPPMLEHLRVSIGTPAEMDRFMVAFRQIFVSASAGG